MTDAINPKSRLHWQCRRGMRELDLVLLNFLHSYFDSLSGQQQDAFERLLDYPDQVLFDWLYSDGYISDDELAELVHTIRHAAYTEAQRLAHA